MCNAWNHAPGCKCGWGGEGHLGRPSYPSPQARSLAPAYCSLSSYTNPNAVCPVCHAQVFFYQSPNGGRVFFDELGPPWPKHPCTDQSGQRSSANQAFRVQVSSSAATRGMTWSAYEWRPFIYDDIAANLPPYPCWVIRGQWGDQRLTLHVPASRIEQGALIHARNIKVGEYELSVLSVSATSAEPVVRSYRAFTSPNHPDLRARRRRSTPPSAVNQTKRPVGARDDAKPAVINKPKDKSAKGSTASQSSPKKGKVILVRQERRELNAKDMQGRQHSVQVAVKKRRVVKLERH